MAETTDWLRVLPDEAAAFAEARRVLAPGGRIAVSAWRSIDRCPGFAAVQRPLERHIPEAATFLPAAFSLTQGQELRAHLTKAGFADVAFHIDIGSIRFPSLEEYLRDYLGAAPIAGTVAAAPDGARAALAVEVAESVADHTDDLGMTWPLETNVAIGRR